MRSRTLVVLAVSCGLAAPVACAGSSVAIEFAHAGYGHYFVTTALPEIAALDAGTVPGWQRTGESFAVFDLGTPDAAGTCRFWSGQTFAPRSSHFYTASAAECEERKQDVHWRFEGEVFAMVLPSEDGRCPTGTVPLYRLYNDARNGAPNHRYTTQATVRAAMIAEGWIPEGAGIGVTGCVPPSDGQWTVRGHVVDGFIEDAIVCLDVNRSGGCDPGEPRSSTDAAGAYALTIPREATEPLVAEVVAGRSRDSDEPATSVDVTYRMATPSPVYGTDITPFSTLVALTGIANHALGEDVVRARLGLPPRYDLRLPAPAPAGSTKQAVAKAIVKALKARGGVLDMGSPDALGDVVAALPEEVNALPRLRIATRNGAPIESKEIYVAATYVLTHPAAAVPDTTLNGRIRGRGNTTWGQPKSPYKVQFTNDAAYAAIDDVLGMRKQRNWALLADYFDRSLIRNKLALSLGSSSVFRDGLKWTPSGQHVEVWLNDDYVGVYLLTEDIRVDPARLDIARMSADPAEGQVDGGYVVEVDFRLDCYRGLDFTLQMITRQGVPICVDTPDEEGITPAQLAFVNALIEDVESDIYGPSRLERLNLASFADWYLLQELFRNHDAAFVSSDFMWKDGDAAPNPGDRLLNMGPIWDFDRSAGNVNYSDNWKVEGCWVSRGERPNWFRRLFDNQRFLALTLERWRQKRASLETFVNAGIDAYAHRLAPAARRNFERWPIFDVPLTNFYVFSNHDEEVAFVRRFLNERMKWLDAAYASPAAFNVMCR